MKNKVLIDAEFNPKIKTYLLLNAVIISFFTVIGIPFLPIVFIVGPYFIGKYFDHLECQLTDRSLKFKKGFLVKVERTIPLDKIQDLTFKEGPILKWLGLSILRIETAGNAAQATADLSLIGIVDAKNFRDTVLNQRDRVTDTGSVAPATAESESMIEVLKEIRDSLKRIEGKGLN